MKHGLHIIFVSLYTHIAQKEQENYRDAVDEIMMLEGDDEEVPYQVARFIYKCSPVNLVVWLVPL